MSSPTRGRRCSAARRARHDRAESADGGAAHERHADVRAAQDLPDEQGRQANRGSLSNKKYDGVCIDPPQILE